MADIDAWTSRTWRKASAATCAQPSEQYRRRLTHSRTFVRSGAVLLELVLITRAPTPPSPRTVNTSSRGWTTSCHRKFCGASAARSTQSVYGAYSPARTVASAAYASPSPGEARRRNARRVSWRSDPMTPVGAQQVTENRAAHERHADNHERGVRCCGAGCLPALSVAETARKNAPSNAPELCGRSARRRPAAPIRAVAAETAPRAKSPL